MEVFKVFRIQSIWFLEGIWYYCSSVSLMPDVVIVFITESDAIIKNVINDK